MTDNCAMIDILSAFGLASAAGLNAYLPLLIVGLFARFTDLITLSSPWNTLENPWVLGVLGVLLVVEMTVDKLPVADSVNDAIQTFVRPAAGAVLFAASSSAVSDIHPVLAMVLGIVAAGGIHAVKATARPVITATTGGLGNPVISVVEDVISATVTIMAVVLPILAALLIVVLLIVIWRWRRDRRKLRQLSRG